jgi:hypothetical protein
LKKATIKDAAGAGKLNWLIINTSAKIKPAKMAGIVFAKNAEAKRKIDLGQNLIIFVLWKQYPIRRYLYD